MTMVLHSNTRALDYHPHIHAVVPGGGMGLAVAQGIVSASCGCMTVASVVGKGSVFRAYLPLSTEQP